MKEQKFSTFFFKNSLLKGATMSTTTGIISVSHLKMDQFYKHVTTQQIKKFLCVLTQRYNDIPLMTTSFLRESYKKYQFHSI